MISVIYLFCSVKLCGILVMYHEYVKLDYVLVQLNFTTCTSLILRKICFGSVFVSVCILKL